MRIRPDKGGRYFMDPAKFQKTDPAILLLNEIDILLAQTSLMELYLKQAQATAADVNARLQEKYEADLASLRSALDVAAQQLQERPSTEAHRHMSAAVEQLKRELSDKQQFLSEHESALDASRNQIRALQNRIDELEAENNAAVRAASDAKGVTDSLSANVAALHQELALNRRQFDLQQQAAQQIEGDLREQLQRLENLVVENQLNASASAAELRKAQQEITALHEHLGSLEAHQDDLQARAASQLEQTCGRFENELTTLRTTLAERDRTIVESRAGLVEIEVGLKSEIASLRDQLKEKQRALAVRDDHLRAADTQIAALQERVSDLDAAYRRAAAATVEIDTVRRSLTEEVANLQYEVQVKEKELTHRHEAVTAVELALHGRIQALQQELARAQEASFAYETELESQRAQSGALQNRIVELERTEVDTTSLENTRQQLESDINRLRADLAQKEYLLAGQERAQAKLEAQAAAEIETLRQQLEQERRSAAIVTQELVQVRTELAATHERIDALCKLKDDEIDRLRANAASESEQRSKQVNKLQLQLSEREVSNADIEARLGLDITILRQQLADERSKTAQISDELLEAHTELAATSQALAVQLRQNAEETEKLRASAKGQTKQMANQVTELQLQLAQKQLLAESRASELGDLRATVSQLRAQLSEKNETYVQALGRWQTTESQQNNDIAQLSTTREELSRAHSALEVQLDQAHGANSSLRAELQEAKNRSAEVNAFLQTNEAAVTLAESDNLRLRSSLGELAALHSASKAEAVRELAETRKASESELTAVRAELQQKSWSLAQQQASIENLAQVHREQIRKLEARLGEHQPITERQTRDLEQALDRADSLQKQVDELQAALQRSQAAEASQADIRQDYAARLDSANALLAAQSAELAKSGAAQANAEETLRVEIGRLNNEMHARTTALRNREDELDRVRAEMTSVQNRIVQFETISARSENEAREIHQAKSALEGELSGLRHELQQKSAAVAQQQAAMDDLGARYRSHVEQLETNLREYQNTSEDRRREAFEAQAQMAVLHKRLEELQSALQQTDFAALDRDEQLRQEYEVRAAALSREAAEGSARHNEIARATSATEQALRGEIDRLIGEAQERNLILQNRNDELVRVKGELDSLSERFTQLEAHAIQAESSASGDAERMRMEYQAQLALLQAELSQTEWAVEERQAIIAGIEQEHRHQMEILRQQLTGEQHPAAPVNGSMLISVADLTEPRRLEPAFDAIDGDNGHPAAPGRRWQSSFGSKRRWRS